MKKQTLEDAFLQLETVIERLEAEDISLEDSFKAYSEGMELLQFCNASIDRVEKKVLKMNEDGELDEF
ncbi:MAG: exodeoxyribonuclease VII small subunit [Lachnospiraceae bacterium]|nr:exodeoxyribonuclease VII small subunit [Lachnospiraceae bacterium]